MEFFIRKINTERSEFLIIAIAMACVIIPCLGTLTTLATDMGSIPYVTIGWSFIGALYFLCLRFSVTRGVFTTVFWVGIVWEILFAIYMIFFVGFELLYFGVFIGLSSVSRTLTIILFSVDLILWFCFIRVIVVVSHIRQNFIVLRKDFQIYAIPPYASLIQSSITKMDKNVIQDQIDENELAKHNQPVYNSNKL